MKPKLRARMRGFVTEEAVKPKTRARMRGIRYRRSGETENTGMNEGDSLPKKRRNRKHGHE
ncbi:hypothetical protein D4T97_017795 [Siminovitchia acidinfaciens]|uniref:Uncharacterized protein n=1 Tax=Siminovitchia acidinfaciens TaxID=2321395 RepID=A0A429XUG1_9BACI|nr:hypothetical protein D4T97_017795 [Siminovitchia acidinfaciens]